MASVTITDSWCKGCDLCILSCPTEALRPAERFNARGIHPPELTSDGRCSGCRLCELICPDFAITIAEDHSDSSR